MCTNITFPESLYWKIRYSSESTNGEHRLKVSKYSETHVEVQIEKDGPPVEFKCPKASPGVNVISHEDEVKTYVLTLHQPRNPDRNMVVVGLIHRKGEREEGAETYVGEEGAEIYVAEEGQ